MGKSSDRSDTTKTEFVKLGQVLNQTAEDTSTCLKLLKKQLSEYDRRNGNHFVDTASSYMRSDMRTAKDTAMELKHVGHKIAKDHEASKTEIHSARNMMDATAKAIESLKLTARNYDKKNGQRMGVKGTIDAAVGGHHDKDKSKKHTGKDQSESGLLGKTYAGDREGGLFGEGNKTEGEHKGLFQTKDNNGGDVMGSSETVETLVTKILRDHFSLSKLDHQIAVAEKSLSPSIVERAKEKIHDVKEKFTGDKHDEHNYHEGRHVHNQTVNP